MLITPTNTDRFMLKTITQKFLSFIKKNWKKCLLALILILAFAFVYQRAKEHTFRHSGYLLIGDPDKIVIVNATESQDVVIIGDPEKVQVKPKKRK